MFSLFSMHASIATCRLIGAFLVSKRPQQTITKMKQSRRTKKFLAKKQLRRVQQEEADNALTVGSRNSHLEEPKAARQYRLQESFSNETVGTIKG